MIRIGIMGATGYTGIELLKLLQRHPEAEVAWLTSENNAGQRMGKVFPLASALAEMPLCAAADADLAAVDLAFCCLPHSAAQAPVARARAAGAKVIDLSADYRLHDPAAYQQWYGVPHTEPQLLEEAVYGLPELHRKQIAAANLVANPGCYPTSIILGLAPLARQGWLSGTVIADSKSGISGGGRGPALKFHYPEANENLSPYSIGRSHRHLAEMEQELGNLQAGGWNAVFSPHLAPMNRGIMSTIYVQWPEGVSPEQLRSVYREMYAGETFVRLLPEGELATVAHTVHSNACAIGLTPVPAAKMLIVTATIDNLIKGASGQAVQNMNLMFGCPETTALL